MMCVFGACWNWGVLLCVCMRVVSRDVCVVCVVSGDVCVFVVCVVSRDVCVCSVWGCVCM